MMHLPSPALLSLVGVWGTAVGAGPGPLAALPRVATPEQAQAALRAGQLTVPGWPQLRPPERAPLLGLARRAGLPAAALVLDLPPPPGASAAEQQQAHELRRSLGGPAAPALTREGYSVVQVLRRWEDLPGLQLDWQPLPPDHRELPGPFDLIGDVHGCLDELQGLLSILGYGPDGTPPAGRTAIFLGDLGDRGPDTPGVLRLVMAMVAAGGARCVAGNHDDKLARALQGHRVNVTHGLEVSLAQLECESPAVRAQVAGFLAGLPAHLLLDGGRLVAAHAGLPQRWHGRVGDTARYHALYGEVHGHDALGLPIRADWAASYRGRALVVYGHTPVAQARWLGHAEWLDRTAQVDWAAQVDPPGPDQLDVGPSINIDTGCVFGGALTALRYPEGQTVSVPARQVYRTPPRPLWMP